MTFTLGGDGSLIRVISERDMHRKERKTYKQSKIKPKFKSENEERAF
jgi:hypothetical protein